MSENLVTKKMTVNNANADQICFIVNLMSGYNESKLTDIKAVKGVNTVFTKAKKNFLDTKTNLKKGKFPSKQI